MTLIGLNVSSDPGSGNLKIVVTSFVVRLQLDGTNRVDDIHTGYNCRSDRLKTE